jgi:hypothetical protein
MTESIMKASRETIKMKTSEGKVKVAVLGDSPGAEEYLQHLNTFTQMLVRKKLSDDLTKCTKAVVSAAVAVRKFLKVPIGEKTSEKAARTPPTQARETRARDRRSSRSCLGSYRLRTLSQGA